MTKEYFTYTISVLAVIISTVTALIAYFNYRLNKSLNIRNNVYNEKLKLYREISKAIASLIIFLQETEINIRFDTLNNESELQSISENIEEKCVKIDYLFLEAYMITSNHIFTVMQELSDKIADVRPLHTGLITLEKYKQNVKGINNQGEILLSALRSELKIEKMNKPFI